MMKVLMLVGAIIPLIGCSQSVRLMVVAFDEEGNPVTNASVRIQTLRKRFFGAGQNPGDFRWISAQSDTNGVTAVELDMVTCDLSYWLTAAGYYASPCHDVHYRIQSQNLFSLTLEEHQKEEQVVLRKIKNPIPMFGYGSPTWLGVKLPVHGEYGYDMKAGDFVTPYGKGKVSDFYIRKNYDEKTRDGRSALFFKGRGNGAYKIKAFTDSEFRSCYAADTNAVFETEFRHEYLKSETGSYCREVCDVKEDECLVLRTRCQYDEQGRLVSCNYSKIYGKIEIRSYLQFRAYAFNPTPNDPNLEFDVKQNLLQKDTSPYFP